MRTRSIVITGGLATALTVPNAFGLYEFVPKIPNGSIASCSTCHTTGFGFNRFGQAFKANNRVWNATLAGLDSDGDGLTNGRELGDPNGTGTPTPGAPVTNPGLPYSAPAPPRPPSMILKSFAGGTGGGPEAGLVLAGRTLYGTTFNGYGTVFKVDTNGTGYTVLKTFTGSDGMYPMAGLVLAGGTLYGTTANGGTSGNGTVFKVNTNGTGFAVLKNFTGSDGAGPQAGLVWSGGTLYGTTAYGGSSNRGTVFKINTDGTGHAALKNFTGSDGSRPQADLILCGDTLYGVTIVGGSSDKGTVFKVNTNGTGFAVLRSFIGSSGAYPMAGLVLDGGTLYGTTAYGGSSDYGTVFKVNTNGTGYAVLKHFTGIGNGAEPQTGLVLWGGTLYGTTYNSHCDSTRDYGTVFKMNTDGTGFTMLKSFINSDGAGPMGGLVLSGGMLYGTTVAGGSLGYGTVFRIDLSGCLPPAMDSQPQSRVDRVGTTASFSVTAMGTAPLTCQWRKDGVTLLDGVQTTGATISGATTTDLTIANVQMGDAGDYTVVVTNAYGRVTSSVAALTVQLPTPIVLSADGSGGFGSNGFGFNLGGMTGQTVVIEASTNLTSWTSLQTNSLLTGEFYFNDSGSTNLVQRFYRARLTP